MEYVLITGSPEAINYACSVPGIRIHGRPVPAANGSMQVHAFCPDELRTVLEKHGLSVQIQKNNAVIDPQLYLRLRDKDAGSSDQFVSIHFSGSLSGLEELGFKVQKSAGNIAAGTISKENLELLIVHPAIIRVDMPRQRFLALNKSIPDIRANLVWSRSADTFSGYTGKGVIIGIVDSGIDFSHKNFRKPDGSTRILSIWDQTLTKQGDEKPPDSINNTIIGTADLSYGVEYDNEYAGTEEKYKKIIQKSIDQDSPAIPVRHRDIDGHGTHVAGIAAGDGSQSDGCTSSAAYKYIGVAPEADLVIVRKWGLSKGDENLPPAITNHKDQMTDAIMYIMNYALKKKKPVAINLSLGVMSAALDGTSTASQLIDGLLERNRLDLPVTADAKGAAIVFAAGNAGAANFHAVATVPMTSATPDKITIPFTIQAGDNKIRHIYILYNPNTNPLELQVTSPLGATEKVKPANNHKSSPVVNGAGGKVDIDIFADATTVTIAPPAAGTNHPSSEWKLIIKDLSTPTKETPLNVYFIGADPDDATHPQFTNFMESAGTLTEEATTKNVISVGAYSIEQTVVAQAGQLADFSSRGPTLDNPTGSNPNRLKPEICAPGVAIFSCKSDHKLTMGDNCCCDCCYDFYVVEHGTSMAAPHITGVAALILQKNPKTGYVDLREAIKTKNGGIPGGASPADIKGWGKGKVDTKQVVDFITPFAAPLIRLPAPQPAVQEDSWTIIAERFLRSPRGAGLAVIFRQFFHEVRLLVNNNKRVAAIWHRNKGPVWMRTAIYVAQHPDKPIPVTQNGLSLRTCLDNFKEVLKRYGSQSLKTAITTHEDGIELLCQGMSLAAVMTAVIEPAIIENSYY